MNNHVYVPLMYLIPWKSRPIWLVMVLVHFELADPFMRYRYSWTLHVFRQMSAFSFPGCMVTSPVTVFLMSQSSTAWLILMGVGAGVGIFLGGIIVAMWLAMMSWTLSCLTLVLYLWKAEIWMMFP